MTSKKSNGEIFNIGSGKPKKIKNIIEYVKKISKGGYPQFGKIKLRKDEILKTYPNIKKAKKKINWIPKVLFKKGLKSKEEIKCQSICRLCKYFKRKV